MLVRFPSLFLSIFASACRFVVPMHGSSAACLLPSELRSKVLDHLHPSVLSAVRAVGDRMSELRRRRDAALTQGLHAIAAKHMLSSAHVTSILACLKYSVAAQIEALVVLWTAIVDHRNLAPLLPALGAAGVHDLQHRLGFENVVRKVHWMFGCHFRFDLHGSPDLVAAARQLCANAAQVQPVWAAAVADARAARSRKQRQSRSGAISGAQSLDAAVAENGARHATSDIGSRESIARALRALQGLEEPAPAVLQNILVDGEPLVGRAQIHLQHLWADVVAAQATTLEMDFVPCVASRTWPWV